MIVVKIYVQIVRAHTTNKSTHSLSVAKVVTWAAICVAVV